MTAGSVPRIARVLGAPFAGTPPREFTPPAYSPHCIPYQNPLTTHVTCFVIVVILWIFSVCLHEFAHAWAAEKGGDYTVREKGYLDLNPLRYANPVTSLLFPILCLLLGGIGLPGGAVYINRSLLRSRGWDTWVSLAGPLANLWMAALIACLFRFKILPDDPSSMASISLAFLGQLQVYSIFLNLMPIPPLDGFQAMAPWLPSHIRDAAYAMSNWAQIIFFIALMNVDAVGQFFGILTAIGMAILGIPLDLSVAGYHEFTFWRN